MPAQNGVRRHEGRDLREQPATKPVSQFSEAALAVVQTQAQPREPALQQSILFEQERDDIGLLTLEPSAQRGDQQLERAQSKPTPVPSIVRCDTTRFVIMLNDIASVSATMPPRAAGLEFSVCRAAFDKATGRIPLPRCCPSSIDRRRVQCVRSADAFSGVVDRRMSMETAG